MGEKFLSLRFVGTALLTLVLLAIGGFNIWQKRMHVSPEDGCFWIQTDAGVQARVVTPEGPCDRAGVQEGDFLRSINNKRILSEQEVTETLYGLGVYSRAKYTLERKGVIFDSQAVTIAPPNQELVRRRLYLEITGIYFLAVGVF